jgi:hypothetical protein
VNITCRICQVSCKIEFQPPLKNFIIHSIANFPGRSAGKHKLIIYRRLCRPKKETRRRNQYVVSDIKRERSLVVKKWGGSLTSIELAKTDDEIVSAAIGYFIIGLLSSTGGLLLHGAFLEHNNKAYLFLGESGAGKSTIAHNASKFHCIHDDRFAVRKIGNRWYAFGVPLLDNNGDPGKNFKAPISGIYAIQKSNQLFKTKVGRRDAISLISRNMILPPGNSLIAKKMSDNLLSFVQKNMIEKLAFMKTSDVSGLLLK